MLLSLPTNNFILHPQAMLNTPSPKRKRVPSLLNPPKKRKRKTTRKRKVYPPLELKPSPNPQITLSDVVDFEFKLPHSALDVEFYEDEATNQRHYLLWGMKLPSTSKVTGVVEPYDIQSHAQREFEKRSKKDPTLEYEDVLSDVESENARKRDLGTAVHTCFEAFLRGDPVSGDLVEVMEKYLPTFWSIARSFKEKGLKVIRMEEIVGSALIGVGGRFDLLALDVKKSRPGQPFFVLVDLKTTTLTCNSKDPWFKLNGVYYRSRRQWKMMDPPFQTARAGKLGRISFQIRMYKELIKHTFGINVSRMEFLFIDNTSLTHKTLYALNVEEAFQHLIAPRMLEWGPLMREVRDARALVLENPEQFGFEPSSEAVPAGESLSQPS